MKQMRSFGGASDEAKSDRMVARARKRQEKAEQAREDARAKRDALVAALEDKVSPAGAESGRHRC
jgi:hypothetical protein